jgi:hypothetical protein
MAFLKRGAQWNGTSCGAHGQTRCAPAGPKQPLFSFNTLNVLASLIPDNPNAERLTEQLVEVFATPEATRREWVSLEEVVPQAYRY